MRTVKRAKHVHPTLHEKRVRRGKKNTKLQQRCRTSLPQLADTGVNGQVRVVCKEEVVRTRPKKERALTQEKGRRDRRRHLGGQCGPGKHSQH
jgi:hypothetical protein